MTFAIFVSIVYRLIVNLALLVKACLPRVEYTWISLVCIYSDDSTRSD